MQHAQSGEGYQNISIRGTTVSELGNVFSSRRILGEMLMDLNKKGVLVYREYDVYKFLWKEVRVKRHIVTGTDTKATYQLQGLRTDVVGVTVPWTRENIAAVQAYCEVCALQNKYVRFKRTNKDKLYLKALTSLMLLTTQLTIQVIGGWLINQGTPSFSYLNQSTPSLLIVVFVQVVWLQVVSEILLSDEGSIELDEHSMRKCSVNRMCAIFYIAHGDRDRKYDASGCSWAKDIQYGDFEVMPVSALECLLGADHLITMSGAWSFNRSGAPLEYRTVKCVRKRNDETSTLELWKVEDGRTYGNPPSSGPLSLVPGFVGGSDGSTNEANMVHSSEGSTNEMNTLTRRRRNSRLIIEDNERIR